MLANINKLNRSLEGVIAVRIRALVLGGRLGGIGRCARDWL